MKTRFVKNKLSAIAAALLLAANGVADDGVLMRRADQVEGVALPEAISEGGCESCDVGECSDCGDACFTDACGRGLYGGFEYLHLRSHFSEAVAFARVTPSLVNGIPNIRVAAEELEFDYNPSFRTYLGYDLSDVTDVRFTYWYYDDEVSVDGIAAPGETLIDPFGNIGAEINTRASVQMNVFDLDLGRTFHAEHNRLAMRASAGVRVANIDQFYDSVALDAGADEVGAGVFLGSFDGAGPRMDVQAHALFGGRNQFALTGKGAAAVLIGNYDVSSENVFTGILAGGQFAGRTRAVPVLEGELGGSWKPAESITISAGWLFQAWFNIGTSGGHFDSPFDVPDADSLFVGADDGDIMSFDGLFVRTEIDF